MNDTNVNHVLDALQIDELPTEEQEALLLDLNSLIFRGSITRLVERMDEQTRDAFAQLVDSGADEEAVETFLRSHVQDADSAVAETMQEISDDILAVTGNK